MDVEKRNVESTWLVAHPPPLRTSFQVDCSGVIRSRIMKSELSVHKSFASIENNSPTRERDHKVLTKESILLILITSFDE